MCGTREDLSRIPLRKLLEQSAVEMNPERLISLVDEVLVRFDRRDKAKPGEREEIWSGT